MSQIMRRVCLAVGAVVILGLRSPAADPKPELVVQTGHTGPVLSVAFSPDGQRVLTGSADKTAVVWDAATGDKLRTLQGHTSWVSSVALSPDGKRALTGSRDNTAILWDATGGEKLLTLKGHTNWVRSAAFSPDGKRALTGSLDKTAVLWDATTGDKLRTLQGHAGGVSSVAFSPDGLRALTGSEDNTAVLWDADSGEKLLTLNGHTKPVRSVALSPDGKRALTGSEDGTAVLWDAATGDKLRTLQGHTRWVNSVAFSPDGQRVLTASSVDNSVVVWDAATGDKLRTLKGQAGDMSSVALSPDGRRVLTGSIINTAVLWDAATGEKLRTLRGHAFDVSSVAFSPDGKRALAGSQSPFSWVGMAVVWDGISGEPPHTLKGPTGAVTSVAFSPDGKHALTCSFEGTAALWDAVTGEKFRTLGRETIVGPSVAFSPDGKRVLTGAGALAADGVTLDHTAVVWDVTTGGKLLTLRGHTNTVRSVAFSPDGKRALTGSYDKTAVLWDATSGEKLRTFRGHTDWVYSVAFSPDGQRVLTGSVDKAAVLWDAATGDKLRTLHGHTAPVNSVAFSPDGKRVMTGSTDNTAVLWDATTGEKLRVFQGHTASVNSVAFSPDGKRTLTGSPDGTVRLWDAGGGDELARLISLDAGKDWLVVTPEGLFDGSAGGRDKVTYRVGKGLTVVPVDRFFQDFYRPGLLAAVWKGERPKPETDFGKQRPPRVRVVSPKEGGTVETSSVTLEAEAADEGGGVRGPWLFHNGTHVLAAGKTDTDGKVIRRRFTVALVRGDNRLEVKASSGDGSWDSEPAVLTLRYEKALDKPELYVLAVGVNRYRDEAMSLKFAADDAKALGALFERRGKSLYRAVHVVPLLDDKATRAGIRDALRDIAGRAKAQDTLVVFFAGHGTLVGQRYYFIPHEFHRGDGGEAADDVRRQGLAIDDLGDHLAAVPALKRLLILDTCQSGAAVKMSRGGRDPFAFRGAVERLGRAQGVFTIAAAAAGEEAKEAKELGHGVLTYALLAGLRAVDGGPLTDQSVRPEGGEAVADVLGWFQFASGQVPRLTKKYFGREQDVQTSGQGTSFPVLPLEDR